MSEEKSDIEMLVPLSNMLVDFIMDKRIPLAIRQEYTKTLDKVFPAIILLSHDYIESKGIKLL